MVINGGINPAISGYSPKPQLSASPIASASAPGALTAPSSFSNPAPPPAAPSDRLTLSSAAPSPLSAPAFSPAVPANATPSYIPLPNVGAAFSPNVPAKFPAGGLQPAASTEALPLSPAQMTGKQVGDLATKLLQEVPALEEKIEHIDWESLSKEDLQPKLEKFRVTVQQHIKHLPKILDRKLIGLFDDPKNRSLATQFMTWLRKEPDPATLALLNKPKAKPSAETGEDDFETETPSRRHALDDSEASLDEALPEEPPKSLFGKVTEQVQGDYAKLKDRFLPAKPEPKALAKVGKTRHSGPDEMSDADLQELLGSLRSSGPDAPSSSRGLKRERQENSL
jgi:hypothetical protein